MPLTDSLYVKQMTRILWVPSIRVWENTSYNKYKQGIPGYTHKPYVPTVQTFIKIDCNFINYLTRMLIWGSNSTTVKNTTFWVILCVIDVKKAFWRNLIFPSSGSKCRWSHSVDATIKEHHRHICLNWPNKLAIAGISLAPNINILSVRCSHVGHIIMQTRWLLSKPWTPLICSQKKWRKPLLKDFL
jgi:hypothetical protein